MTETPKIKPELLDALLSEASGGEALLGADGLFFNRWSFCKPKKQLFVRFEAPLFVPAHAFSWRRAEIGSRRAVGPRA